VHQRHLDSGSDAALSQKPLPQHEKNLNTPCKIGQRAEYAQTISRLLLLVSCSREELGFNSKLPRKFSFSAL
jgi:hypothetical protein